LYEDGGELASESGSGLVGVVEVEGLAFHRARVGILL
jgi:hypothetical protein